MDCPYCQETIKEQARICIHCQSPLAAGLRFKRTLASVILPILSLGVATVSFFYSDLANTSAERAERNIAGAEEMADRAMTQAKEAEDKLVRVERRAEAQAERAQQMNDATVESVELTLKKLERPRAVRIPDDARPTLSQDFMREIKIRKDSIMRNQEM